MGGLGLRGQEMNTKSHCDNENMPSQQAEVGDGGPSPGERRIWHLIFLTMKDDNGVAGANFFSDGEKCPLPYFWYLHLNSMNIYYQRSLC